MDRFSELCAYFEGRRAVVAFSGGADSALLLEAARRGGEVLAVTAATPLGSERELSDARAFCAARGILHRVVRLDPLELPEVRENRRDRCYHCKKKIFETILKEAAGAPVFDGTNASDVGAYRPGRRALEELGIRSPLLELGFEKPEIIALSEKLGLETAKRPPAPCLATRFPYGTCLSREKLRRVERLEEHLRGMGICACRCRIHGELVRVEVERSAFPLLERDETFPALCHALGFYYVTLDLEGLRSGSMDIGV